MAVMPCHCGKTGLYRLGNRGYCKEHIGEAKQHVNRVRDPVRADRAASWSQHLDDEDKLKRTKDKLKGLAKKR